MLEKFSQNSQNQKLYKICTRTLINKINENLNMYYKKIAMESHRSKNQFIFYVT